MGRFDRRWSDEQRAALISAVLDRGLSAPKAVKLAHEGKLAGLPAYEMPIATARAYVRDEKRRRRGLQVDGLATTELPAAIDELARRLIQVADRETSWMLDKAAGKTDIPRLERLATTLNKLALLTKQVAGRADKPPDERAIKGRHTRPNQATGLTADLERASTQEQAGTTDKPLKPRLPGPSPRQQKAKTATDNGHKQDDQHTTPTDPDNTTNSTNKLDNSDFMLDARTKEGTDQAGQEAAAELAAELEQTRGHA